MKHLLDKAITFVVTQKILVGIGAVVVLVAGVTIFNSNGGDVKTLTVERKDFVQTVSVSGKVQAANEVDLGFSQSGRIARVYAMEGQVVGEGTLIAEIENGDLYATLLQKQAALDRAEAQLDALKRGTRPEELAVTESAVSSAEAALTAANQGVVDAVLSAYATADSAVHATADQFFSNPNSTSPLINLLTSNTTLKASVESRRVTMEFALKAWAAKIDPLRSSSDLNIAASEAQASLQGVMNYLSDIGALLATSIPSSTITQATLDTYKTSVATARTSLNTASSALTTAYKAETTAQTALVTAERDLALARAGATPEDIRAQEASVKAAEADVLSASSQLTKTQIRAPFKGVVTKVDAKVGKSVSPGEAQVSVIGSGVFEIETFVPELNVSLVQVGNPAAVTFDSYGKDTVFPAEVLTVDLGETVKDGVSTYRTVLVFKGTDARIRSGMTANVVITTLQKEQTISIPQKLVTERNGVTSVRVVVGDGSEERAVTTGAVSSTGDIEIVSGLSVGDQVLLE